MSTFRRVEDMVNIGAYARGSNAEIDEAIAAMPDINAFLCQDVGDPQFLEQCMAQMRALAEVERPRHPRRCPEAPGWRPCRRARGCRHECLFDYLCVEFAFYSGQVPEECTLLITGSFSLI